MRPIFIVGCDRSGTTLLRLMLDRSPDLHIPAESGFLPELVSRADEYGDFTTIRGRSFFIRDLQHHAATSKTKTFDIFGLTVEEADEAIAAAAPTSYSGAAAALFQAAAAKQGKPRWGDKTPRYVLHLGWLAEAFPRSRMVHIIRDPRDVTRSIRRVGWTTGYRGAAEFWRDRVTAGLRSGRPLGPDRYREVRYEALVRDAPTELDRLCDWLEIEYSPEMLRFFEHSREAIPTQHSELFPLAKKPVDASRAGAWRDSMDRQAVADVEEVAGELMRELGYEVSGAKPRLWAQGVRWGLGKVEPLARRLWERGLGG